MLNRIDKDLAQYKQSITDVQLTMLSHAQILNETGLAPFHSMPVNMKMNLGAVVKVRLDLFQTYLVFHG